MAVLVIAIVLLFDQIVKIWVKTNMCIGETALQWEALNITWFRMTFLENNGAAGGLQLFGNKVLLTLFRLIAIGFVGYHMWKITKYSMTGPQFLPKMRGGKPMFAVMVIEEAVNAAASGCRAALDAEKFLKQ